MFFSEALFGLVALASTAHAWLPTDTSRAPLLARDGTTLFNNSFPIGDREQGEKGKRYLPGTTPIRGVNLGSLFVAEPWMMYDSWSGMKCPTDSSEFDCVLQLGQSAADAAFQQHWRDWVPESDFDLMKSYGLNTVRIPIGYWLMESLVYGNSEHFPRGGLDHLKRICGYATSRGMYIILDLHGAPGAQVARNSDTGQLAPTPGFYQDYQFQRGYDFLAWLRQVLHENSEFSNVGMIEVVNEPLREWEDSGKAQYMRMQYYPNAYQAIRNKEAALGIAQNDYLHVQFQNKLWGSGDPQQNLSNNYFAAYDDHRYVKYALSAGDQNKNAYLRTSCNDDRSGDAAHGWDWPVIVGEFSLSAPYIDGQDNYALEWSNDWRPDTNQAFYSQWFKAQVLSYEKHVLGWVFWNWHTEVKKDGIKDYRWGYKEAVQAGVIPTNLGSIATSGACNGF